MPSEMLASKQGTQVSTATKNGHCHNEKLSGDTYQPLYSTRPTKRERSGRGELPHKSKIRSSKELRVLPERVRVT